MTSGKPIYNQRDIVIMPFYFSDGSGKCEIRPVLILSNDNFNSSNNDIIGCMITTNPLIAKHSLNLTSNDLSSGNLKKPSRIRCNKVLTCQQSKILKKIGSVEEEICDSVISELKLILDRNSSLSKFI